MKHYEHHTANLNTMQHSYLRKNRIKDKTIPFVFGRRTTDHILLVEYSFEMRYKELHKIDRPEDGSDEKHALVDLLSRDQKGTKWQVQLFFGGRRKPLESEFTQGAAYIAEPSFADVLHCLAMDARCACGSTFKDFCSELGYDDDSIKAKGVYEACLETMNKFINMFGIVEAGRLMELEEDLLFAEFNPLKTYSLHAKQRKKVEQNA